MTTDSYFYHYLFLGIFVLIALIFPIIPLVLAKWVAPKKPSSTKQETYECGLVPKGDSWIQFRVQYYIFALIFVIFDVETIFIYPWAVAYNKLGLFALVEMIIFIAILFVGFIYAWQNKLLEWET